MVVTRSAARKISSWDRLLLAQKLTTPQAVLLIIATGSLLRLVLAHAVGLGVDESYMAGISRQFHWSYFDHPPLHAWLAGGWAEIFGESPLALRLPFIVLFAGTTWLMYALTAEAYGERAGLWAVIAFSLAPVFTLSTASWVLPDGPLMFFLLLAAVLTRRALTAANDSAAWLYWLGAGAAGGLAMLSKYLAIFFFAGAGLYLLTSQAYRLWLTRPQPWAGIALACLIFAPVIVWNVQNDFASFAFQGVRARPESLKMTWLLQGIGGQLLYLMPWIAIALFIAIIKAVPGRQPPDSFFVLLSAPAIGIFLVLAFVTRILPHWAMAGWLFAFPLLGRDLAALAAGQARILKYVTVATTALLIGFFALAATQAQSGWASRYIVSKKDPTIDLYDWRDLAALVAERNLVPTNGFIAAGHWIEAGKINYALADKAAVLCLCDDPRGFAFLHDRGDYVGTNALLLSRQPERITALGAYFNSTQSLPDIVLTRAGHPAITLKAALGLNLKAAP